MEDRVLKTRKITDASLIVALYIVFLLISRLSGLMIEYDLFFILPVPLAIYAYKYDLKTSIIPFVATFALSFAVINYISALVIVLPALIEGILYGGFLAKKKVKYYFTIMILSVIGALKEILVSIVLSKFLGINNIFQDLNIICNQICEFMYKVNGTNISTNYVESLLKGIVPFIIISTALIEAICTYLLFTVLASKLKLTDRMEYRLTMDLFMTPKWIGVVYLFMTILLPFCLAYYEASQIWQIVFTIIINIHLIMSIYMLYQGVLLFAIYGRKKGGAALSITFMILGLFLLPITCLFGAFDILFGLKLKLIS